MARASANFINVALDGDKGTSRPVMKKFGVRGYPTVIFLKPNEEEIERLSRRDPESVKQQLERIFKDYAKEAANVTWVESIDDAKEAAGDRLIFVFFHDDKKGSRLMNDITLANLKVLKKLGEGFVCVKVEYERKSDLAKEYKVTSAPTMVVLDSEGKKIASKSGAKKPKQAISFLEKTLKSAKKKSKSDDI